MEHEDSHQLLEEQQPAAPKVYAFVPSYNHAPFVESCLRSIIKQALKPTELLVIDDGSTDGSPQIIERILEDCPFPCELIVRANRGLCATLNEGLARSRGDYFAYLGSDDLWLNGFLEARTALLESRPRATLAYGHCYLIDEQSRIVDCTNKWATYSNGDARKMLLQTTAPMSPTVVYRRNVLERHGWNEKARLEDYDLYLRLCVEGEFAFDPQILSAWRLHGRNTSWNQTMMLEEQLEAQQRARETLGISPEELEKLQTTIRFNRAEDFLRIGQKAKAFNLISHNIAGANSPRRLARMLLRLLIPFRLIEWRKTVSHRRTANEYGMIEK
ncbi:MAG: glycosyltransferase [Pyrinomonadaceae bacterium]